MIDYGGLEVWRGGVNTWECDEMGHLNVRFYVARAIEGLSAIAAAMGLKDAFRADANSTLAVRDHHIRFLKEARAGAPLHMVAGVLEMGDCEARILQLLIHSATGELAAGFQTRLSHVTVADARPFSWSPATRALGEGLRMDMPERAAPRSLDLTPSAGVASLAEAERMGLIPLATGAVAAAECDVFGRMRADAVVGRVSDGIPALGAALRAKPGEAWTLRAGGVGGAVLEYRVAYHAWPRAGDRLVVRSGLASIDARTQKYVHWILDPDSGRAWATAEAIAISLDLGARKVIANSAEDLARLGKRVTPGLAM